MKLLLRLLIIITFFQSCSKDSKNEYYVKYIIESTSSNPQQTKLQLVTTITDEFSKPKEIKHKTGGKWELTIGPVKKGFNSKLSTKSIFEDVTDPLMPYNAKMNLKIEVSINNAPFSSKKMDDSAEWRKSAEISHTIN
jgi:PBP1b-binding outer membrane lipoprotein LpoB